MKVTVKESKGFWAALVVFVVLLLGLFCQLSDLPLIIPLVLLFLGIHLYIVQKSTPKLFLELGLLLTLFLSVAYPLVRYIGINPYYLPVASVAMLTILLFNDLELAFIVSFAGSALMTFLIGQNFNVFLVFFLGSVAGSYLVRDARTRGTLMNAGFAIAFVQVIGIILVNPDFATMDIRQFVVQSVRPLALNGIFAVFVVISMLKIFELLFGVLTNFSLSELSDFNQPLLRRMIMEAPGTYHHSLIVSNLAETAADAIGANSLLTRVGAYYHDIGKMEKAEYFNENQILSGNKHDKIEPSISRLVILNHVKEGVELARKYKLNRQIIDFIPQHHGTSLMHYFYCKALEDADDDNSITEENYRYPGPKPQSRETAIVLLADSVEAATRSLDETNPVKIEEVVRKIINNKFIDGQLDECNLTLKEIESIAQTFTRVLSAMYHGRVKYPDKKNGPDNRNRKQAEADSDKPAPPQPDRSEGS